MNTTEMIGPVKLLGSSWFFLMKNWKKLLQIISIPFLSLIAIPFIVMASAYVSGAASFVIAIVMYILMLIMMVTMYPAIINTVHRLYTETAPVLTIKTQYKFGIRLFWSTLSVLVVTMLVFYGSFAMFIVPGIIVGIYASFSLLALVIDDKRNFSAISTSFNLVKGQWWAIFGRVLFLAFCALGTFISFEIISFLLLYSIGTFVLILVVPLIFLVEIAIALVGIIYMYQLYSNLKSLRLLKPQKDTNITPWIIVLMIIGVFAFAGYMYIFVNSAVTQYNYNNTKVVNIQ